MSEETAVVRSPEIIAQEIIAIKTETFRFLESATGYAHRSMFEIGRLLCEAKENVPGGEWTAWLRDNVEYSEDTAQNLMRIFREFDRSQAAFENLNYSQMVALFALPAPQRAEFAEANHAEDKSAREIKRLIAEKKALEKELKQAKAEAAPEELEKLRQDNAILNERLTKTLTSVEVNESVLKKREATIERMKEKETKLQRELDELKENPPTVQEATEEQLARIRSELETELRAELEKTAAKDAARQDPLAVEVNVLFAEVQSSLLRIRDDLKKMSPDVAEKLGGMISARLGQLAEGLT